MSGQSREIIDRFAGPYAFLSNFHPCRVTFYGLTFATVYKGNIIKINNGLPILRRDTAQTRLRAVFL